MRRVRDRRRHGAVTVNLALSKERITPMVKKGWLRSEQLHDRQAVGEAVLDLAAAALWLGLHGPFSV